MKDLCVGCKHADFEEHGPSAHGDFVTIVRCRATRETVRGNMPECDRFEEKPSSEAARLASTIASVVVATSLIDEVGPKPQIVCIVGSREVEQTRARARIEKILEEYDPETDVVISGERGNVDIMARRVAEDIGFRFVPFAPRYDMKDYYLDRNWMMANACTVLYRITTAASKTYGSGWTRDRAKEMGKPTFEFVEDAP